MNFSVHQDSQSIESTSNPLTPASSLSSSPTFASSPFLTRRHHSVSCPTRQINFSQNEDDTLSKSFSIPAGSHFSDNSRDIDQKRFHKSSCSLKEKSSWKESLTELSEKLQLICGSGSQSLSSNSLNSLKLKTSGLASSEQIYNFLSADNLNNKLQTSDVEEVFRNSCPETPLFFNNNFSSKTFVNDDVRTKKYHKQLKRTESVTDSEHCNQQVVVRHFETSIKLHNQLAQITGLSSKICHSQIPKPNRKRYYFDIRNKISAAKIQEESFDNFLNLALKKQQIDIFCEIETEHLIVRVDKVKRKIFVENAQLSNLHVPYNKIHKCYEFDLESDVPECCLCLSNKNKSLTITQHSADIINLEYNESADSLCLPVVKGDEKSYGKYTISMYVPKCCNLNDISVQTVDDRLFIIGKKDITGPKNAGPEKDKHPHVNCFKVDVKLPSSVDCRLVSSYYTKNCQLIVSTDGFT
ncbi:hypothetical protein HELRODRAFT_162733 [Helobdella robusta]|uniref:SHSP domain-containing protein n=1 Tax=Helobdella robusta TaxID=6412 RepID=T1ET26_HELRO|nr:hypothetical protein HELRODRAFT_162733 [Helobdella robusta]ESN99221.1 hypothetical protein HELRODRAFT_162733 [Helobdella robusta]